MTMVEKVAAAIARQVMDAEQNASVPNFVDRVMARHQSAKEIARAALAAMDDPTPGMVEAGQETGPIGCCNPIPSDITEIWQAMIRAALDEGEG